MCVVYSPWDVYNLLIPLLCISSFLMRCPRRLVFWNNAHCVLDCRVNKFKKCALGDHEITFIFFHSENGEDQSSWYWHSDRLPRKNWGLTGFYKARRRSRGILLHWGRGAQSEVQQMFRRYRNTFVIYWLCCRCFCHRFLFSPVFCMPTSLYIHHWGFRKPHESWHFWFRMTLNWSDCDLLCSIAAVLLLWDES